MAKMRLAYPILSIEFEKAKKFGIEELITQQVCNKKKCKTFTIMFP